MNNNDPTAGDTIENGSAQETAPLLALDRPDSAPPTTPAESGTPSDLVLVFDTETTGLPLWHQPSDDPGQPHILELAYDLCAPDGTVIESYDEIVNIGVPILPEMTAIHGITDEMAAKGIPPKQMVADFLQAVDRASVVAGHVVSFDLRMVRIQAARLFGEKWDNPLPTFDTCTAAMSAFKVKKLKLAEAIRLCFDETLPDAHRARPDCTAARRLYFALRDSMSPKEPKENPRVRLGDNQPPADVEEPALAAPVEDDGKTPFERVKTEIDDLVMEARNWLDGEGVSNEDQASKVAILRDRLRDAARRAEELRKAEARPFDDGKAAVQARYNPLIQKDRGLCDIAIDTCNNVLKPFLKAKDDAQRAEAQRLHREAQEAAATAQRAAREAADTQDIGTRETAEALIADARSLIGDAKRADAAKPQVAGATRAVGLKSVFTPELVDPGAALTHYRQVRPAALKDWLIDQAKADVRGGHHAPDAIPGFTIKEDRVPV